MIHFLSQPTLPCLPSTLPERVPASKRLPSVAALASLALLYAAGAAAQSVSPSVTLSSNAATVAAGTPITLTATVPVNGVNLKTGIVRFCDLAVSAHCMHENKLANAALTPAGTATYKFTPGPGAHNFVAVFLPQ